MIMSGSLAEWSVDDLLQIVRMTQKTTSIVLTGTDRSGVIHLRSGEIVAVESTPSVGEFGDAFSQIVEAIHALTSLTEGSFELADYDMADDAESFAIEHVMVAVEKDRRREKQLADLGITSEEGLRVVATVDEPLSFEPLAWQLLQPLVSRFSIESLEQRLGRGRAIATILMLDSLGLLERDPDWVPPVLDALEEPSELPATPREVGAEPEGGALFEPGEIDPSDSALSQVLSPTPAEPDGTLGEHYVEVFDTPVRVRPMHEVVAPSETTLVSGVLGDLKSRFRDAKVDDEAELEEPSDH